MDTEERTISPTPTQGGLDIVGSIGGPNVFTNFNPMWGNIRGVSFGFSGPSYSYTPIAAPYHRIQSFKAEGLWKIPEGGWDPVLKKVLSSVLSSVGYGDYEQGVFDRPVAVIPSVLSGPTSRTREVRIPAPVQHLPTSQIPEAEVVTDWGTILGGVASEYIAARYAPQPQFQTSFVDPRVTGPVPQGSISADGVTWGDNGGGGGVANASELCGAGPCSSPRYLTYDCRTGTFSKKRRRRRGRLLTASDQHDLGVIVAMFGKGAAGQIALAAAVKR